MVRHNSSFSWAAIGNLISLSPQNTNENSACSLQHTGTSATFRAVSWTSASSSTPAATDVDDRGRTDDDWYWIIGCFDDSSSPYRRLYINATSNISTDSTAQANSGMYYVRLAERFSGVQDLQQHFYIAHACIWDIDIAGGGSTGHTQLMTDNKDPSTVYPSNLVGYWPLDADSGTHANEGAGASCTLTTGADAVWDSGVAMPTFAASSVSHSGLLLRGVG
jgi:hypothetical protein